MASCKYSFHLDNLTSSEEVCGECDPYLKVGCGINEVCSDFGQCVAAKDYELFNLSCSTVGDSLCGQLPCYNRRCVVCKEGSNFMHYYCKNGQYKNKLFSSCTSDIVGEGIVVLAFCLLLPILSITLIVLVCFFKARKTQRNASIPHSTV